MWKKSCRDTARSAENQVFLDNIQVRIHLIIEMILVDRPCANPVWNKPCVEDTSLAEMWSGSEEGSYLGLLDCCNTQV